jgi:phosphopentomutase
LKANRIILIVLDSVGIGYLPDAHEYGDEGANTLGNIAKFSKKLHIPHLIQMGLGNIDMENQLPKSKRIKGSYTKSAQASAGKDTTTGHWEIAGAVLDQAFPTFLNGFPRSFLNEFENRIGIETIGNISASGTEIINQLGDEHVKTKKPIVYTSADSVFQIAMHEHIYSIDHQYEICTIARQMLQGDLGVGRVIARPFIGSNGMYTRTHNRKDFSLSPPNTILDAITKAGNSVHAIGKIYDIFDGKGITSYTKTSNNQEGIIETIKALKLNKEKGLIFTNLVDFDMHYGHRRDIEGYAHCLNEFDESIPNIIESLDDSDILIITADHGNDPSYSGTDHTREFIPILVKGKNIKEDNHFQERNTFADIGATIAEALGIHFDTKGVSFLSEISINYQI